MNTQLDDLRAWMAAEYQRRTEAVENGTCTNVDWVNPEYRVSWSEVVAKAEELGLKMHPVDLRLALG